MSYMTEQDIRSIQKNVKLLLIKDITDISKYPFDSNIHEYNDFLKIADKFFDLNISKTFLLFHRKTNELLAYMTLSADSINLTREEKDFHNIAKVPYASIRALKVMILTPHYFIRKMVLWRISVLRKESRGLQSA